ncbi:hypothetical protein B4589_009825 [Halolamina sp. CBA1230]|uniref:hypothetical protein n=1 Tax=Halolamina sp. CBA1230 TaxID=1853690 RepID=UPI0009A247C8|nr:hypothetical protein [Halolamina sp. CBA1230]QKY20662.1 hypothetical protein B4589_009825 [Halolamina sp. CBA1230]
MTDEEPEDSTSTDDVDPAFATTKIAKAVADAQANALEKQLSPIVELIAKHQRQRIAQTMSPIIEMQQKQLRRSMKPVLDAHRLGLHDMMNPGLSGVMQALVEAQRQPLNDLAATLSQLPELEPELASTTATVASATATPSTSKRPHHDTTWDPDTTPTHPTSKARTQGIDPVDAFSASLIAYTSVPNYSELDEREQQAIAFVIGGVLTFGVGFLLLEPVTATMVGLGGGRAASILEAGRVGRQDRLTDD